MAGFCLGMPQRREKKRSRRAYDSSTDGEKGVVGWTMRAASRCGRPAAKFTKTSSSERKMQRGFATYAKRLSRWFQSNFGVGPVTFLSLIAFSSLLSILSAVKS
jgi:hypothetical protein